MTSPISPNREPQRFHVLEEGQHATIEDIEQLVALIGRQNEANTIALKNLHVSVEQMTKDAQEVQSSMSENIVILQRSEENLQKISDAIDELQASEIRRAQIDSDIAAMHEEMFSYQSALLAPFVAIGNSLRAIPRALRAPVEWVETQHITAGDTLRASADSPPPAARRLMATLFLAIGTIVVGGSSIFLYKKVRCMDSYFLGCAPKIMG